MAFEELQQLLARREAVEAKQDEVLRLIMLATTESLASGEIVAGDPEFVALAARGEAFGVETLRGAAAAVDKYVGMATEYAAEPGGEAVAEAARRLAYTAAALGKRAAEYAAFMRRVGALPAAVPSDSCDSDSSSDSEVAAEAVQPATTSRPRRRNAKYFGPEWAN